MANSINRDSKSLDEKDHCLTDIESRIFPTTFLVLKAAGLWLPTTVRSRTLYICYKIYSIFCATSVAMLIVTVVLHNVLSDDDSLAWLMECWYMLVVFSNGIVKITNIFWRRSSIIKILQSITFEDRWSVARNDEERAIFRESERAEKFVTQLWFSMILINGFSSALNPFIHENPNNALMFDCYSPCDRSRASCFWTAYVYQLFGYSIVSIVHVGCDCLIFNFIERLSSQLKIFASRLQRIPAQVDEKARDESDALELESFFLKDCIRDHHSIYRTVQALNDTFYEVVSIQFLSTISILCTNIYFLSKQELFSPNFVAVSAFLCCALTQNFFFCWYGYKLSESSADVVDAIFYMDWFLLGKETRKMLYFMMMSASNRIDLFNNAVVNLSPESFLKLVKLSYSAFNLLQQSN